MADKTHALLSPSSSSRWLACPGSAHLNALLPEKAGEFAEKGDHLHRLAELTLRTLVYHDADSFEFSDLMEDYPKEYATLVRPYVDFVMNHYKATPGAHLFIESKFDMGEWCPDCFGTGDAVIIADGIIEVIDFKSGTGVQVNVEANPQLQLYALGAYAAYRSVYDVHTVRMTIVQPGLDNIQSTDMTIEDLLDWGESIKPLAQKAYDGKPEFHCGAHCRFCKAVSVCPAQAQKLIEIGKQMLKATKSRKKFTSRYTLDQIAKTLTESLPALRSVKTLATKGENLTEALITSGTPVPGFQIGKRGIKIDSAGLDFADLNN